MIELYIMQILTYTFLKRQIYLIWAKIFTEPPNKPHINIYYIKAYTVKLSNDLNIQLHIILSTYPVVKVVAFYLGLQHVQCIVRDVITLPHSGQNGPIWKLNTTVEKWMIRRVLITRSSLQFRAVYRQSLTGKATQACTGNNWALSSEQ